MSEGHPEKRSFLHSTSDADSDSDFEHEKGRDDLRLANQVGSGSFGAPRNSYVTHDFKTFRAAKLDPVPSKIVSESSNLLRNVELEDARRAEGSSQRPSEESLPSVKERSSFSSIDRPQQSIPQSVVSDSEIHGEDVGRRNSYVHSVSERRPTPFSEIDILREEAGGRISFIGSGSERRPSLQSSEIDILGEEVGGRTSFLGSGNDRRPSVQSPFSNIDILGEETGGRTSFIGSGNERRPSVQSQFLASDTLGGGGGRNSYTGHESESSVKSPFSVIDTLGKEVHGSKSYVSSGASMQSPFSDIDAPGEEVGTTGFTVNGSEKLSAVESSISEIDSAGKEIGGRTSYSRNGSERQPSVQSPVSEIGLAREEVGGRTSYTGNGSERWPLIQSPLSGLDTHEPDVGGSTRYTGSGMEMQPVKSVDTLGGERGGRSSYTRSDSERWLSGKSPLSDSDKLGEEVGARNSYMGGGSERRPSAKPLFADSDRHGDERNGRDSYVDSAGVRWDSANEPLLDMVQADPLRETKRTSVNLGRRVSRLAPVSDIDSHGEDVGGKSRFIGSGSERRPSVKEQVADEQSEIKRASLIPGRRVSRLSPPADVDRDPESPLERIKGRGSASQSSRRPSRIVSPTSEAESDVESRERDEYGEVDTIDTTAQQPSLQRRNSLAAQVGERVPPEWALLLLGCFLGLATGLSVVIFNKGVHVIHDMAWAGTPREGAAWLRLQKLIDIWHRVMLIPVVGGVVVGLMHAVVGVLDQVKGSRPPTRRHSIDWLAGVKPTVKAGQAMVTLGTGCSLGPEGPSVDIGKAWAHGLATIMKNNRERRIALVAAGAAAGISAGFNAPVSGMFFAIETVLRPEHAENSPPLTTAMIILASVISSTVSQVLLQETAAFTVPTYELRSAAELPLYLLLGGVCGVVSVIFTRLTTYFTEEFEFLRDRIGIPHTVTPAIGGLVTGLVALKYPGVLYWGFYNVDEILHSGKTATAPGAGLVTQLICAKVFATAFCKGSGLVGGVYAPSLFVGAAVGSVYGTMAGKIINAAIPGHDTVAHPQAYALVGMAALLAAVCSVPLTSVLLLFELTKDYHILLPLMGGIGVAIWVAAVAKQSAEKHFASSGTSSGRLVRPSGTNEDGGAYQHNGEQRVWRRIGNGTEVELCTLDDYEGPEVVSDDELMGSVKVSQAMSKTFVKVQPIATVKETIGNILLKQQRCALVVDENDLIEGIFTFSDLETEVMRAAEASAKGDRTVVEVDKMLVAAFCSGKGDNQGQDTDLVVCFPDVSLKVALDIMESSGFKQLPVVARAGKRWQDEGRQIVGLIDRDAIPRCIKEEASKRISAILSKNDEDDDTPLLDAH